MWLKIYMGFDWSSMVLDLVTFLFILFHVTSRMACNQVCCGKLGCYGTEAPFQHFPPPECPTDEAEITFSLHTRGAHHIDITSGNMSEAYQPGITTIFIIHGFGSKKKASWVLKMKDEFLKRGSYNVIIVGWDRLARRGIMLKKRYNTAASTTRVVGEAVARVGAQLRERRGRGVFWCVGHSLGAHTCGHAGKEHKWDRVTGLDPAGPLFDDSPPSAGLHPDTGRFVDVIHTHGGKGKFATDDMVFGTIRPLGHVDFYPNGGRRQPGCRVNRRRRSVERYQRDIGLAKMFTCSHTRAHKYFTESINSKCAFLSPCRCSDHNNIPGSCNKCLSGMCPINNSSARICIAEIDTCGRNGSLSDCQRMGFHAKPEFPGMFYLGTDRKSPYCLDAAKTAAYINRAASFIKQTCYLTVLFSSVFVYLDL